MSFAIDGQGRAFVLDEVNGRIVRYGRDGKPEASIPMDRPAAQDIATAADGSLAVLDRFGTQEVAIYDPSGALRGALPLGGEGIEDTGEVTGVFVDGKDIYVEREHGPLVRVGDTTGLAAEPQTEIPGRPSRDGTLFLNAGITDSETGRTWVSAIDRASGDHRFTRELRHAGPVHFIALLDSDKHGTIYFAAEVGDEDTTPEVVLSCLEPVKGVPFGGAIMPANTLPEETFRDLTVLDDGGVVYALRSDQGVSYQYYGCD